MFVFCRTRGNPILRCRVRDDERRPRWLRGETGGRIRGGEARICQVERALRPGKAIGLHGRKRVSYPVRGSTYRDGLKGPSATSRRDFLVRDCESSKPFPFLRVPSDPPSSSVQIDSPFPLLLRVTFSEREHLVALSSILSRTLPSFPAKILTPRPPSRDSCKPL